MREYGYEGLWAIAEPGEEEVVGIVLEVHGYFDVRPSLDASGTRVRELLNQAFAAVGGLPAGGAVGWWRKLKAGNLVEAWLLLERFSTRRTSNITACWSALVEAARMLEPEPGSELAEKALQIEERLVAQQGLNEPGESSETGVHSSQHDTR